MSNYGIGARLKETFTAAQALVAHEAGYVQVPEYVRNAQLHQPSSPSPFQVPAPMRWVRKTSSVLALGAAAVGAAAIGAAMGVILGAPQQPRPLRDIREYPLGFFQSGIGSCTGAIDVVSRPQIVFRGERLIIPPDIADMFSVIDIKVGNRSQLANSTAIPGYLFTKGPAGTRLALDTATVAQDIAVVVENLMKESQTFMAAMVGTAAQ